MQTQPPPPLPPVYISPSELKTVFAGHPVIVAEGKKFIILGLRAYASHAELEAARKKFETAGWSSDFARDREGVETLLISTKSKSLEDTRRLGQQARDGVFGAVTLKPFVIPAPGTPK